MALDEAQYRQAIAHFATGVTVVTAISDGRPAGMTASAVCSLSVRPVLEDTMAYFVCDVHERFPGGDHSIFIGEVTECAFDHRRRPLLYFRSGFGRIEDPEAYLVHDLASWERISWPEANRQ